MIEISRDERVLRIALNRPEKRNALNIDLCRSLVEALAAGDSDTGTGAILITANGGAFCGGMDLHEVVEGAPADLVEIHEHLFTTIAHARKPIVAAVHGAALAGGLGLVANAHVAVASPDACFGLTEVRLGLWPVLVFRAVALAIGERRATEMSLTGRIFDADEAFRIGLIAEIAEDPLSRGREITRTLAGYSPVAIAEGLGYVNRIRGLDWTQAGKMGHPVRERLMTGADFEEGVRAFFEKRKPRWPSIAALK